MEGRSSTVRLRKCLVSSLAIYVLDLLIRVHQVGILCSAAERRYQALLQHPLSERDDFYETLML
jgi:hypothetical protein